MRISGGNLDVIHDDRRPANRRARFATTLLLVAWALLLGCLSASLLGQHSSARAFDCEMSRLDALANKEGLPRNRWATCNRISDGVAAILLVAGIGILAAFAYTNAPFGH